MQLIPPEYATPMAGAVINAVGGLHRVDDVQRRFLGALFALVAGQTVEAGDLRPVDAAELAEIVVDDDARSKFMHLLVVLELMADPVSPELERRTERYGDALEMSPPLLAATRRLAREQYVLAYLDLSRNSWYVEQTLRDSAHGRLYERLRSEIAYIGFGDAKIAERWRSLGRLPPGSWGREVDAFYDRHGFPRPGEPHGIYELGARHDWIHVLTGYDTDPVGELQVFGFIAANMVDPHGFTMLAVTLGLFQSGTITHMHGKRVRIATSDALAAPGASESFARAIVHGYECPTDVMAGIDLFAEAARPLDEVRGELGLPAAGLAGRPR